MRVAVETAQTKIFGDGWSVVELRPDVIDAERERIESLGDSAIFASAGGADANQLPQLLIHVARGAPPSRRLRCSRALACAMARNAPTWRKASISALSSALNTP